MSGPIVFISNQRIKTGCHEAYRQNYIETVEWIQQNRPRTVVNLAYIGEDGTQASIVIVFPDAEAMENHMQGLGDLPKRAQEFMEITSLDVYGSPSDATMEVMRRIAGSGIPVRIRPEAVGGYLRLAVA